MKSKIKIGLALSGGAMRGLAHIGVIEILEEHKIPIHMIAGTSMGSVVGGIYSAGMPIKLMRSFCEQVTYLEERKYIDVTVPRIGLIKGKRLETLIYTLSGGKSIEELNIPYTAVACCVEDSSVVYFDKGNLVQAIRASIAIPGIFEPVTLDGKTLVDGGVLERLPVNVLIEKGCDYVIAVDVGFRGGKNDTPKNIFDVLFSVYDMLEWQAMKEHVEAADVTIHPDVRHVNPATFTQAKECMDIGREAAESKIEDIKMQLSMMGYSFN